MGSFHVVALDSLYGTPGSLRMNFSLGNPALEIPSFDPLYGTPGCSRMDISLRNPAIDWFALFEPL